MDQGRTMLFQCLTNTDVYSRLYKYVYKRVRDEQKTQDIVQETIAKALESGFRIPENCEEVEPLIRGWLFKIAFSVMETKYRREKVANRLFVPQSNKENEFEESPNSGVQESCEDEFLALYSIRQLIEIISQLSPRQRQIVVLLYEGYTHKEIAEIMHIPIGTVKSTLGRLHQRMREQKEVLLYG